MDVKFCCESYFVKKQLSGEQFLCKSMLYLNIITSCAIYCTSLELFILNAGANIFWLVFIYFILYVNFTIHFSKIQM